MKIFAIMLLMLFGTTFLKAQTMVVETADGVESFEVGEIKSLRAFEKAFKNLKVELKKIPILIKDRDGIEKEFLYNNWQSAAIATLKDSLVWRTGPYINFAFIFSAGKGGGGSDQLKPLKVNFNGNNISDFFFYTTGSVSGCEGANKLPTCYVYGEFEIGLINVNYTVDSTESINATITNKNILTSINSFKHLERISFPKDGVMENVSIVKIREEDLTDDSQIIITIE